MTTGILMCAQKLTDASLIYRAIYPEEDRATAKGNMNKTFVKGYVRGSRDIRLDRLTHKETDMDRLITSPQ